MILERDAFTVEYDASLTSLEDMYAAILDLGYTPRLSAGTDSAPAASSSDEKIPQSIADALLAARAENKYVFIDFYAPWCIACKALDQQTISSAEVQSALQDYVQVKIDTDLSPDSGIYYQIVGLPTLIVLDSTGKEIFRSVGPISPFDLANKLNSLHSL